jgi:hypothetical protein
MYKKMMLTKETKDEVCYAKSNEQETETLQEIDTLPDIEVPDIEVKEEKKQDDFFQPRQRDTLFWCLYVLHHGMNDYIDIGFNYGVKELEEKQRLAVYIRENTSRIKGTNHKVTNVLIQEILSELLTSQKDTSLNVLGALCVFYNMNILLVDADERCMLEFLISKEMDHDTKTYVLYKDKFGKYRAQLEWLSLTRIQEMREKYMVLDSYSRPIKASSHFKSQELVDLAKKLGVYDENRKYKKQELYDVIHELCKWK